MQFRAAVLRQEGTPLVIEEVEMTGLGPNDVLVRIRSVIEF
jgi:Zn-dependent alcohol dehydrogenase